VKSSNTNTAATGGGITFVGALQVAFIVLKLCGVISWSWGWVLAPIWVGFLFSAIVVIIAVLIAGNIEKKYTK
jgi:hypothetical protein